MCVERTLSTDIVDVLDNISTLGIQYRNELRAVLRLQHVALRRGHLALHARTDLTVRNNVDETSSRSHLLS